MRPKGIDLEQGVSIPEKSGAASELVRSTTFNLDLLEKKDVAIPKGRIRRLEITQSRRHTLQDDGHEVVVLTVRGDESHARDTDEPCKMQWLHIESPGMMLKEFQNAIYDVPGLTTEDKGLIAMLFKKVRRELEKSSRNGKYLEEGVVRLPSPNSTMSNTGSSALFFSMPFFFLGESSRLGDPKALLEQEIHPVRTLMQAYYRFQPEAARDLRQAVSTLDSYPDGNIVHVPQFWGILVNEDLIVTYACVAGTALQGNFILFERINSLRFKRATNIRLFDSEHEEFFFYPLKQCQKRSSLIQAVKSSCAKCAEFSNDEFYFYTMVKAGKRQAEFPLSVEEDTWDKIIAYGKNSLFISVAMGIGHPTISRRRSGPYEESGSESLQSRETPENEDRKSESVGLEDIQGLLPGEVTPTGSSQESGKSWRGTQSERSTKGTRSDNDGEEETYHPIPIRRTVTGLSDKGEEEPIDSVPILRKAAGVSLIHDTDDDGRDALYIACMAKNKEAADMLINNGFHPFCSGPDNLTTLHWAALNNWPALAQTILDMDPTLVHCYNISHQTPLHLAAESGSEGVMRLLLKSGARVNSTDESGKTPLHVAAKSGNTVCTRLLLENGAHQSKDFHGMTPLHEAAGLGKIPIMELLLDPNYSNLPAEVPGSLQSVTTSQLVFCGSNSTESLDEEGSIRRIPPSSRNPSIDFQGPRQDQESPAPPSSGSTPLPNAPGAVIDFADVTSNHDNESTNSPTEERDMIKESSSTDEDTGGREDMWTEITKEIVIKEAIEQLGYDYEETNDFFYITKYLFYDDVIELVELSDSIINRRQRGSIRRNRAKEPRQDAEEEDRPVSPGQAPKTKILRDKADYVLRLSRVLSVLTWPAPIMSSEDRVGMTTGKHRRSNGGNSMTEYKENDESLQNALDDIHRHLSEFKDEQTLQIYDKVPDCTLTKLQEDLKNIEEANSSHQEDSKTASKRKVLLDMAQQMLDFFVPISADCNTTRKYWGAVAFFIKNIRWVDPSYMAHLQKISLTMKEIKSVVSVSPHVQLSTPPTYFIEAFERLILFYCTISNYTHRPLTATLVGSEDRLDPTAHERINQLGRECQDRLLRAKFEVFELVFSDSTQSTVDVGSDDILLMIFETLLKDVAKQVDDFNITEVYEEYTSKLQLQVRRQPTRRLLSDLMSLGEEIKVVQNVLDKQLKMLSDSAISLELGDAQRNTHPHINATLERCKSCVTVRKQEFLELQQRASMLREQTVQLVECKQDENANAIFVFTVTTIIFLPLSFVSSFLGMNTADIRGMNSRQGLFWAIAIPVTVFVVAISVALVYFGPMIRDRFEDTKERWEERFARHGESS